MGIEIAACHIRRLVKVELEAGLETRLPTPVGDHRLWRETMSMGCQGRIRISLNPRALERLMNAWWQA